MTTRRPSRLGLIFPAFALTLALVAASCGGSGATSDPVSSGPFRVVTTTTVFADLVEQVGGSAVEAVSLVPKGGEVHTFDPAPGDLERVATAELLVANGLGLDDWLVELAADAGSTAPVIKLGETVAASELIAEESGAPNPHLWLDAALARGYVEQLAAALATTDSPDAEAYTTGGEAYAERLDALDAALRQRLSSVPESRRRVISFHDAFPYFARAYGLEVIGTIVDAPGQDPSAGEIADLVADVRAAGVSAIVAEAQFSDDLVRTLADETSTAVISDLYTDTLGDPPVDTFEGMLSWDADRIVEALAAE